MSDQRSGSLCSIVQLGLLGSSLISSTGKPTKDDCFRARADGGWEGEGDVAPPAGWLREYNVQFVVCGVWKLIFGINSDWFRWWRE